MRRRAGQLRGKKEQQGAVKGAGAPEELRTPPPLPLTLDYLPPMVRRDIDLNKFQWIMTQDVQRGLLFSC